MSESWNGVRRKLPGRGFRAAPQAQPWARSTRAGKTVAGNHRRDHHLLPTQALLGEPRCERGGVETRQRNSGFDRAGGRRQPANDASPSRQIVTSAWPRHRPSRATPAERPRLQARQPPLRKALATSPSEDVRCAGAGCRYVGHRHRCPCGSIHSIRIEEAYLLILYEE